MMGTAPPAQRSLFYTRFNLDQRVPANHPLRNVLALVDFDFVCGLVEDRYGTKGNESVPPAVILKLMFLLAWENVVSERELMQRLAYRLDWLWFLGMDLDSAVPDHSVLSKARKRWGVVAFRDFFQRVLQQAKDQGLIDGSKIFCDGTLIDANASRKSVVEVKILELNSAADELERRLDGESKDDDHDEDDDGRGPRPKITRRSTTDPDAAVVTKPGAGPARPRYKAHRAIDDQHGVITATIVTPGDRSEADELIPLIDQHEHSTRIKVQVAVGDTQYGTSENYLACVDRGITPHMRPMREVIDARLASRGLWGIEHFAYDEIADAYRCPAGQILAPWQRRHDRNAIRYAAGAKVCGPCPLRSRCTGSPFRTITRHRRERELQRLRELTCNDAGKRDLRRRKHLMERSFAAGTRHGVKRSRWRRLWRAEIHELLVAIAQNVAIIVRHRTRNPRTQVAAALALAMRFAAELLRTESFLQINYFRPALQP